MTDSSQPAATLTISRGPDAGRRFDLDVAPVVIGRHEQCDIQVQDRWMSRQHACIAWTGSGYTIEDLGSTNGTFVNGERVTGSRALKSGDHLRLGEEVELAFGVREPVARPEARALPGAGEPRLAPGPAREEPFLRRKSTRVWGLALLGLLVVLLVGGGVYYLLTSKGQPEAGTPTATAAAAAAAALPGPTTETEAASPTPTAKPASSPMLAQADATFVGPMTISSRGRNASAEGGEIEFTTSADGTALVSMSYSFIGGKCTYVSGSSTTTVTGGSKSTLYFVNPVPITNGRFTVDFMGVQAEGTLTLPSEANGEITINTEEMMTSPSYEKFVCEYGTWTWTASVK